MGKNKVRLIVGRKGSEHMNRDLEIDDGHPDATAISETQRRVNKLMGVSDEEFIAQICKADIPKDIVMNETQRRINKMMGVDDATFKKYNSIKEEIGWTRYC